MENADAVHPGVAAQQPGPELLAVLVRLAHHERLDAQRVLADDQVAHRLELVRAGQGHHVRRVAGGLARQLALGADPLDQRPSPCVRRSAQRRAARSARGARSPPHGRPAAAPRPCGPRRSSRRARPHRRTAPCGSPARVSRPCSTRAQSCGSWPFDQHAADAVPDGGDQAADRGRDHRGAAGLRLERDQPERLVVRRHRDQVRGAVQRGQVVAGLRRQEAHRVGHPERRGQLDQRRSAGPGRCRWGRRRSPP